MKDSFAPSPSWLYGFPAVAQRLKAYSQELANAVEDVTAVMRYCVVVFLSYQNRDC